MNRIRCALLCVLMIIGVSSFAYATENNSGSCGSNLTWEVSGSANNCLTISGTGVMNDYVKYDSENWNDNKQLLATPWSGFEINKVILNNGLTHIGAGAFSSPMQLSEITIPASVKTIGNDAFLGADIKTLSLPDNLESIGKYCFSSCYNLETIKFSKNLKVIDRDAFLSCSSIKKISLPDGLQEIGDLAFCDCVNLEQVTLPGSLAHVGASVFSHCFNLRSIIFDGTEEQWRSLNVTFDDELKLQVSITCTKASDNQENGGGSNNGQTTNKSVILPGFHADSNSFGFTNCEADFGIKAGQQYPIHNLINWDTFFFGNKFDLADINGMYRYMKSWGGCCAGMTSLAIQYYLGIRSTSDMLKSRTLRALPKPNSNGDLSDLIGMQQATVDSWPYHYSQNSFMVSVSPSVMVQYLYNKVASVNSTKKPVYIDYCWIKDYSKYMKSEEGGTGAHAIFAYGIEENGPYLVNGKYYEYRVLTIDPNNNYIDGKTKDEFDIFISKDKKEAIIPKSGTNANSLGSGSLVFSEYMRSTGDFTFQLITDNIEMIMPHGTVPEKDYYLMKVKAKNVAIGHNYPTSISENGNASIIRKLYTPSGDNAEVVFLVNKSCNVFSVEKGSIEINFGNKYVELSGNSKVDLNIDANGNKMTINSPSPYKLEIATDTINDKNKQLISIEGSSNLEVETTNNITIKADNLSDFTVRSSDVFERNKSELSVVSDSQEMEIKSDGTVKNPTSTNSQTQTKDIVSHVEPEVDSHSVDTSMPSGTTNQKIAKEPITISKAPASVKAKAKKNKVTVSWKKIKKSKKTKALLAQIRGIEVQYSEDPSFPSATSVKVPLGKKKTKLVLKRLPSKTTYYVRVRYTDGAGGYSNWSKVKAFRTK